MSNRLSEALRSLDRIGRAIETTLLVLILGGLIVVAVGQIVLREFFSYGFIWANELQNLMVLWLAMFAAIAAARDDRHIRIDALSRVMPKGWVRVSRVIVDVFAAIVCAVIAWHVYEYVKLEIELEDTVLVDVPAWIVHGIMPIAFVLTGYRFVVNAIRRAAGIERDEEEGIAL
ncbi:MAG TPA: TRAP transporter small permease [Woeseiaceae bacterium]|nr:TRAP transporter small permease [Woeseiaceae bacterium]